MNENIPDLEDSTNENRKPFLRPPEGLKKYLEINFDKKELEYDVKVYRVIRRNRKTYKTYVAKYQDECPDEDQLGEEFGGGQFWIVCHDDPEYILEQLVFIDDIFTAKYRERTGSNPLPAISESRSDMEGAVKLVKEVFQPMLEAVTMKNKMLPDDPSSAAGKVIEAAADAFTRSMSKIQNAVTENTVDRIRAGSIAGQSLGTEVEERNNDGVLKEIIGLIKEWGPKLINGGPVTTQLAKELIKEDPRVPPEDEDPQLYDAIYTMACQDPEIGKAKIDVIFQKLGFNISQAA